MQGKCKTLDLGNHPRNDFELGALDLYDGSLLGDCELFPASAVTAATVFHEDTDGWRGDFVKILLTGHESALCPLEIDGSLDDTSQITVPCISSLGMCCNLTIILINNWLSFT